MYMHRYKVDLFHPFIAFIRRNKLPKQKMPSSFAIIHLMMSSYTTYTYAGKRQIEFLKIYPACFIQCMYIDLKVCHSTYLI